MMCFHLCSSMGIKMQNMAKAKITNMAQDNCLVFVERLQPSHSLWTGEVAMSALPCWLWV